MYRVADSLLPLRPGGLPLHRQAEEAIRRLMAGRDYAQGGLLPDEMTIANRLGISRGTVRAALMRLVGEGSLERKAGVGTRVVTRALESGIGDWRSFSREMERQGVAIRMFRCELRQIAANPEVAAALRIETGTLVQRLDRVRGWGTTPILRSRSWFHPRIHFAQSEDFSRPLYDLVAEVAGQTAERAREAITAVAASAHLSKDLRVSLGSPLLLRCHTVFDSMNRPFEFAEVHYVSGRFTLTLNMKRDTL
jgi:GntR family transcriptional regulator